MRGGYFTLISGILAAYFSVILIGIHLHQLPNFQMGTRPPRQSGLWHRVPIATISDSRLRDSEVNCCSMRLPPRVRNIPTRSSLAPVVTQKAEYSLSPCPSSAFPNSSLCTANVPVITSLSKTVSKSASFVAKMALRLTTTALT